MLLCGITCLYTIAFTHFFFILFFMKGGRTMNIKYIGNDTRKSEKGKIHKYSGNYTACGARIDDNPNDWKYTSEKVTCEKNGCKN